MCVGKAPDILAISIRHHAQEGCFELIVPMPRTSARIRAHADSLYFFNTALYSAYRAYEAEGRPFPEFEVRNDIDDLKPRATGEAVRVVLETLVSRLRRDPDGTRLHDTTIRRRKQAAN